MPKCTNVQNFQGKFQIRISNVIVLLICFDFDIDTQGCQLVRGGWFSPGRAHWGAHWGGHCTGVLIPLTVGA